MRRHLTAAVVVLATSASLGLGTVSAADAVTGASHHEAARRAAVALDPLPASSQVGAKLTLEGKVAKGAKVTVQRQYAGGGWAKVGSATGTKKGTWSLGVKLVQGGTTKFRAVKGSSKSPARAIAVYQWLDVADGSYLDESGGIDNTTVSIHRKSFGGSFVSANGGTSGVVVETSGLCTKADLYSGFRDADAGAGAAATQDVSVGGFSDPSTPTGVTATTSTHVGAAKHIAYTVSAGTTFVAFGVSVTDDSTSSVQALGVLATPRVFCNAAAVPAFDPAVLG